MDVWGNEKAAHIFGGTKQKKYARMVMFSARFSQTIRTPSENTYNCNIRFSIAVNASCRYLSVEYGV